MQKKSEKFIKIVAKRPQAPKHIFWASKNSKSSKGDKISLELTLTPSMVVDLGYDDNNISGTNNFAKIMFVYPPRDRIAANTNLVSKTAFEQIDMSFELLSRVRRSNKQIIESEGTGVVIARAAE